MQHMQFITAFITRNRYRAIKLKIAITVCVRLKKSIFCMLPYREWFR